MLLHSSKTRRNRCLQCVLRTRSRSLLNRGVFCAQKRSQQAAQAAQRPVNSVQQSGLFQDLAAAQGRLNDSDVSWKAFLGWALFAGVTFGSFIQVMHNNPNLPVRITNKCCNAMSSCSNIVMCQAIMTGLLYQFKCYQIISLLSNQITSTS